MRFSHANLAHLVLPAAALLSLGTTFLSSCGEVLGEEIALAAPNSPVPAPLFLRGSAFEAAGQPVLPAKPPEQLPGIQNVYRLSSQVISGSEPHGDEAFAQLARMGVRTILSVDGKTPDQETASQHGLRYVHVPIQYRGMQDDELRCIAKTFRELEGPYFVHCFHGRHRGPAAAAIGRVVVDGVGREQAMAEMRQWCGTAEKYEGLYRSVAIGAIPGADETDAIDWDFPAQYELEGFRQTMVPVARAFSFLEDLAERDFRPDPSHPDLDALNESQKLREAFSAGASFESTRHEPDDFRFFTAQSEEWSARLVEALGRVQVGEAAAVEDAHRAMREVENLCARCHEGYRN